MFFPATIKFVPLKEHPLIFHTISKGHFMLGENNKKSLMPILKVFSFFLVRVLLRPIVMKVAMQHKMPVLDHVNILCAINCFKS